MSIYADNWIVDEDGKPKLVKHLNQRRIDRGCWNYTPGGWNKSGKKARVRGGNGKDAYYTSKSQRKIGILKKLNEIV